MKFLLFGTGDYYERYKKWFYSEDIVALLDNSSLKQNTIIDGKKVLPPEEGVRLRYDAIVILSFYVKAMKAQLIELGVSEKNIYHFYDLHQLLQRKERQPVFYYGDAGRIISGFEKRKKVLLLSQELTIGGPPIALFHVAEVLKKYEYEVVFASMIDGPLRKQLTMSGIPVAVDENMQVAVMNEVSWLQDFSLIICNTINFHIFLSKRNKKIPVIWWLHDAPFFYEGIRQENMDKIPGENLNVVSVGPIPKKAVQQFLPELVVKELLYGVADQKEIERSESCSKKMCIVTIGFLEEIKGQDLLMEAVRLLPEEHRRKVEVFLVGYDDTLFAEHLKEKYALLEEVQFTGRIGREQIHELLGRADLLVCPSRQDSMPTVVAEAMMHSLPCVVSDTTGTAAYMKHGENGLIFPAGDVQSLKNIIAWCVVHRTELKAMGKRARQLFCRKFSMETFEKNFMRIVCEMLERT